MRCLTAGEFRPALPRSGRKAEDLVYKDPLRRHVVPRYGRHLTLGEHRYRLHPGQGAPRRPEALEAEHGSRQAFHAPVILLDPVVEPPAPPVAGEAPQLALALHAADRRVRTAMVELAWLWLRNQPDSALSRWFRERVGQARGIVRRIAIVAVARRLLVALWRYATDGVMPEGAVARS